MMKNFETIRDVVDNAIEVHHQAGRLYARLSRSPLEERARLLAQYMAEHERHMQENVKNHRDSAREGILETYIQYTLEEPPEAYIEGVSERYPLPTTDELCEIAQEIDRYLVALFEEASMEIDPPSVREYLDDMLYLEELERNKLTQTVVSMLDT